MACIIVTGASSGIGRQAALDLQAAGRTVVATARTSAALRALRDAGLDAVRADLERDTDRARLVRGALHRHGQVDALVNNAGFGVSLPVEETPVSAVRSMLEVNLVAVHHLTQLVLPGMRQRRAGRIVNVSSIAGRVAIPMIGAYSATKAAVSSLSRALQAEVRPFGIRVSVVEPGRILTAFSDRAQSEREALVGTTPQGPYAPIYDRWRRRRRLGAPATSISRAIVHACTARRPRARYVAPWDAKAARVLLRMLPARAVDFLLARYFRFQPPAG